MAMNYRDQMRLRSAGFLPWEIQEFATATAPDGTPQVIDLQSKTWSQAIESRRNWIKSIDIAIRKQKGRRATQWDINKLVNFWYTRKVSGDPRSPWDLIRAEYQPNKTVTDYQAARRKKAQVKKKSLYSTKRIKGKPYG